MVETSLLKATSVEQLAQAIKEQGHELYYRDGRAQGIRLGGPDGEKHRFSRLGFKDEVKELESKAVHQEKELKELKQLRGGGRGRAVEQAKQPEPVAHEVPFNDHQYRQDMLDEQKAIEEAAKMVLADIEVYQMDVDRQSGTSSASLEAEDDREDAQEDERIDNDLRELEELRNEDDRDNELDMDDDYYQGR